MSSNFKHRTSQSGAIVPWLLVVTTVTSLVLLLSWVKQGELTLGSVGESVAGDSVDPPVTELKLLAAEVISRTIVTGPGNAGGLDGQSIDIARAAPVKLTDQVATSLSSVDMNQQLAPAAEPAVEPVAASLPNPFAQNAPEALAAPELSEQELVVVSEEPLPTSGPELMAKQTMEPDANVASERLPKPDSRLLSEAQSERNSDFMEEPLPESVSDPVWESLSHNDWQQVPEMVVDTASDASLSTVTLEDAGIDVSQIAYLLPGLTDEDPIDERVDTEYAGIDLHESEVGRDSTLPFNAIRSLIEEASAIGNIDFEQDRESADPDELVDVLERQSAEIRFAVGSKIISEQMEPVLTDIFDALSRDDDTQIKVSVTTHESGNGRQNLRLSQERGRALIARWVSQGIDFSRFSLEALDSEGSAEFFHTVKIEALPASSPSGQ